MRKKPYRKYFLLAGIILGCWFFVRYGLTIGLPFFLGAGVALAAEPMVGLLHGRLRLPRPLATGVGVTMVFVLLLSVLVVLIGLLVKEARHLGGIVPELADAARQGMNSLEGWLLGMAQRTPDSMRVVLTDSVEGFFSDGSAMMDRVADKALGLATGLVGWVSEGALGFGTGILAAFMISARLPQIRAYLAQKVPQSWRETYLPALKGMKDALFGWLWAQLKLAGVALVILFIGFWALQIPYGPVWAVVVALVDAFPVLGVGTVLIPWSLICLLQGQQIRGIGLLGIYALVWLTRSVLEPKLVGKELGLDPLITLLAMYAGFKLFGLLGMILSPILAVAAVRLIKVVELER